MGGKHSAQRFPVRANPNNVVPNMLGSLNQLMEWEEKLPFLKDILASQALWSSVPGSLTREGEGGAGAGGGAGATAGQLQHAHHVDPERIQRELEAPAARATTALVHTATARTSVQPQQQRPQTIPTHKNMMYDVDVDMDIPGPVVSSSELFGQVALSHVSQSARRLTPIPQLEHINTQTLFQQTQGEKQPTVHGAAPTAGIISTVYPQLPATHAARVLGLTSEDMKVRQAIQDEIKRLGNTTEIKDRITLICKYFFIHDLLQKMVRSSEHCYKLQQRQLFEIGRLSNPSLAPMERLELERRLNTTKQLLTDALGNHHNANGAVSWLRRDWILCAALYDNKAAIARATQKNQDTPFLKHQQQRISLDLDDNETKSLNLGLFYLDKNWDGVLDAEEVPMLSARLFALLDRDRTHAITPQNLQAAAIEANERVRSLSVRLNELERDASALQGQHGEEAQAQLHRIQDQRQRVMDQKIQLLAVVRSIVRYFHRAFTLHLFSKLDDQPIQVEPVDAEAIFRVMDDVLMATYFDPVKPAATYFTQDEEQAMLYDTLGPMKKGIVPSRRSALDMADTAGVARLERGTAEGQLVSLKPSERQHLIQVSQAYPSAPQWDHHDQTYQTKQEIGEREQDERSRQDMLRDVERRDMSLRSSRLAQQQQDRQRDMELLERQYQQDMTRQQQLTRQQQETADREREREREQQRMRAQQMSRERDMQQQQQQQQHDIMTRQRQPQDRMKREQQQREQQMEREEREREREHERQEDMKRQQQQQEQREREREHERKYQQQQSFQRQLAAERERERQERQQRRDQEEQQQQQQQEREPIMQQAQREQEQRQRRRLEQQAQAEAEAEAAERERERERERDRTLREEAIERQRRVAELAEYQDRQREHQREREQGREQDEYFQTPLKQQQQQQPSPVPAPAMARAPVSSSMVSTPAMVPASAPAPAPEPVSSSSPTERMTYHELPREKSWLARERDEAATRKTDRDVLTPMREWSKSVSREYKEPYSPYSRYEHEYDYQPKQQPQPQQARQPSFTQRIKQAASNVLGGTGTGTESQQREWEQEPQQEQPAF